MSFRPAYQCKVQYLHCGKYLYIQGGGGGVNFHFKGYIQMCDWKGYTFQASKYMNGYHFQKYINGVSYRQGHSVHITKSVSEPYNFLLVKE